MLFPAENDMVHLNNTYIDRINRWDEHLQCLANDRLQ